MLNGLTIVASAFIYQHDNSTTKTNKFLWAMAAMGICVLMLTYACSPRALRFMCMSCRRNGNERSIEGLKSGSPAKIYSHTHSSVIHGLPTYMRLVLYKDQQQIYIRHLRKEAQRMRRKKNACFQPFFRCSVAVVILLP